MTRDDSRDDSDLDILIAVRPGRRFSLLDLSGVGLLIEDLVALYDLGPLKAAIEAMRDSSTT